MSGLLPCPFCGHDGCYIDRQANPDGFGTFFSVKCLNFRAESGQQYASHGNDCPNMYAEVRERWNSRAVSAELAATREELAALDAPALLAEVAELREAVKYHMAGGIELVTTLEATQGALQDCIADCTANHERAEAAEKVGREAVGLLRALLARDASPHFNNECRCPGHSRRAENEYEGGRCPHQRAKAFIAHHGAGTGEGNDPQT